MFLSCKESVGKSLADHLLKDGSQLEEGVDKPQAGLQAWICVRVGMLGPLLGFDSFGPFEWRWWAKIHDTHSGHQIFLEMLENFPLKINVEHLLPPVFVVFFHQNSITMAGEGCA